MSRLVNRAENWQRVYSSFQNINFAAFDYNTIKQSLLEYIKLYFPETFNDYIETSEFIAIVETFAYICELIAYRLDLNAHENFMSTAQRRDSVLRLAKFISYKADRPLPNRGLVKIQSVSTTEVVFDANGTNLAGRVIRWNDLTNANWKDQFILIMNRVLERPFGSVMPSERFQIEDVLFEQYSWDLQPLTTGVFTYTASVSGSTLPMELVPVTYSASSGIIERRPQNNANFTLLYGSDGLGDASNTTGFFCYTKQGTLQKFTTTFDGITPNLTYDITVDNVNNTDVWLNNINPDTGATLDEKSILPYKPSGVKSGEWVEVDIAHAQNVIFNTNPARNKYEVETLDNNRARLIFGDGEFADIPKGTFNIWARTSANDDVSVPQSSVINIPASFSYIDAYGRTQTFTFTFSLISSLQNGSAAETLEHIRLTAPSVYYTQDRMVNGADYNTFPLQDSSILKLRSIDRTFAGDSKYIAWHDPRDSYANVKMFSGDGIIYFEDTTPTIAPIVTPNVSIDALISTYVQPLISSPDIVQRLVSAGVDSTEIRKVFNAGELATLTTAFTNQNQGQYVYLYYDVSVDSWTVTQPTTGVDIQQPLITVYRPLAAPSYTITVAPYRIVVQSSSTKFWNNNSGQRVIDYDTLRSNFDQIVILQANSDNTRKSLMTQDWSFDVIGLEVMGPGVENGLPDVNRVNVMSSDSNNDGIPDNVDLHDIINPTVTTTTVGSPVTLPIYYIARYNDIKIVGNVNGAAATWTEPTLGTVTNQVTITSSLVSPNTAWVITVKDYVYSSRLTQVDPWVPQPTTFATINTFATQPANQYPTNPAGTLKRNNGRDGLNFLWTHFTTQYHLVDPAASNIIDTYIITKGYYDNFRRWLAGDLAQEPAVPTPLDLKTSYDYIFQNGMISDTIIPHAGRFKLLFGPRAIPQLQATFKVIRADNGVMTDNQIKTTIVSVIQNYFDVTQWEFGETFLYMELGAAIQVALVNEITSVVPVPTYSENQFGDMFEVLCNEDQVFYADISVDQIEIVSSYTATNLRING